MDIIFYKSTNEVNSFPKSLTDGVTISGSLRSECDILNPVIEFTGIGVDIPYNYCYIPTFKRYYFITEARSIRNDILMLYMSVDVLQSWCDDILNLECIIGRQEFDYNDAIEDKLVPLEHRVSYTFTNLFSDVEGNTPSVPEVNTIARKTSTLETYLSEKRYLITTANAEKPAYQSSGENFNSTLQNTYFPSSASYLTSYNGVSDVIAKLWSLNGTYPYTSRSELVIKVSELPFVTLVGNTDIIKIGNEDTSENLNGFGVTNNLPSSLIYRIKGHIKKPYNDYNFLNYSPYTKYQIHVPFYGYVDIDDIHLYNGVEISIYMDYATGYSCLQIRDLSTDNLVISSSLKLSKDIPISSSNASQMSSVADFLTASYEKAITHEIFNTGRHAFNTMSSMVNMYNIEQQAMNYSSGIMSPGQLSSFNRNYNNAVNSAISAAESAYNVYKLDEIKNAHISTLYVTPNSTSYTANSLSADDRITYIIQRNCIPLYPDSYNHHVGRPSLKTQKLNTLRGYTIVDSAHLDIPCTLKEIGDIEKLLSSGVIITSNPVPEVPEEPSGGTTDTPSDNPSSGGTFTPVEPIEPIEPETKWLSPWSGAFRVTSTYGEKRTYTATNGKVYTDVHQGLDMVGIGDINIYSIAEGTVEHIGWQNASNPSAGFGYYCRVNTNGKLFYYAHMRADSSTLKVGDTISKGTKIGVMGSTGQVTGAHLHLEVRGSTASSSHENICSYTLLPNEIGTYE